MDKLQQVKAKLEEMKAKYNFERENEDNPNHSDGWGMFYSGFFTCLKEISFFVEHLEVKKADLNKELKILDDMLFDLDGVAVKGTSSYLTVEDVKDIAKRFFELGLKIQKGE